MQKWNKWNKWNKWITQDAMKIVSITIFENRLQSEWWILWMNRSGHRCNKTYLSSNTKSNATGAVCLWIIIISYSLVNLPEIGCCQLWLHSSSDLLCSHNGHFISAQCSPFVSGVHPPVVGSLYIVPLEMVLLRLLRGCANGGRQWQWNGYAATSPLTLPSQQPPLSSVVSTADPESPSDGTVYVRK